MRRRVAAAALALALVAACAGASSDGPAPVTEVIEVFSVYRGADAEAFRLVLDDFETQTGFEVVHVGSAAFADRIRERIDDSDPPDVALFPQPGLIRGLATSGQLLSLEAFSVRTADTVRARYPPLLGPVTVGGQLYGVPWRVDVGSLVWYRPQVFEQLGYWRPTSFFDFQALVSQMTFDGETAWCLGIESFAATGWVGTDWIEDIVLRTQPVDVYDAWAIGEIRFDDERIQDAMTLWSDLALAPGRTLGTPRTILSTAWELAGDPLFADPPGCLLHRQLGQYRNHVPDGMTIGPNGDVDVFVIPGAGSDPVDVVPAEEAPLLLAGEFAVALTPKPGVEELLLFLSDPTSAEIWAWEGGYLSPHLDFDVGSYANPFERTLAELVAAAEVLRFDASDTMPPSVGVGTFWDGVVDYVATGDLDRSVAIIQAGYRDEPNVSCRLVGNDAEC